MAGVGDRRPGASKMNKPKTSEAMATFIVSILK